MAWPKNKQTTTTKLILKNQVKMSRVTIFTQSEKQTKENTKQGKQGRLTDIYKKYMI